MPKNNQSKPKGLFRQSHQVLSKAQWHVLARAKEHARRKKLVRRKSRALASPVKQKSYGLLIRPSRKK